MNEPSLHDVLRFHAELLAVAATDLPVALGMGETPRELAATCEQISHRLQVSLSRGRPLMTAIDDDSRLSSSYKSALKTWLLCEHTPVAFESLTSSTTAGRQLQRCLQLSLVKPALLLILGYFAFIAICLYTVPKFEGLQAQLGKPPGPALMTLIVLRNAMPMWVPLVPSLLTIVLVFWPGRNAWQRYRWLPGSRGYVDQTRRAAYAERVASFLDNHTSLAQALEFAGPQGLEPSLTHQAAAASGTPATTQLPPLLRWATSDSLTTDSRTAAMQFVARCYQRLAELEVTRLRAWLPSLLAVALGGGLVLAIALSVFLPLIEFLLLVAQGG